jgi:hypothetical protein
MLSLGQVRERRPAPASDADFHALKLLFQRGEQGLALAAAPTILSVHMKHAHMNWRADIPVRSSVGSKQAWTADIARGLDVAADKNVRAPVRAKPAFLMLEV